jgi:hypothetical protein
MKKEKIRKNNNINKRKKHQNTCIRSTSLSSSVTEIPGICVTWPQGYKLSPEFSLKTQDFH